MKILINTASTHKGGGVQVARSFIEECRNFIEHEYHVILGSAVSNHIDINDYPNNFSFYQIGYRPATRVLSFNSHNRFFRKIEGKVCPDVVFTTSGPAYWRPKSPHLVGYNLPHYLYKDSPFFSKISLYKRFKWDVKGLLLKFFFQREADAYVVQTDDVNQRLRDWLQRESVHTVSNTFSRHYEKPKKVPNKLPEREKGEFRFLTLSAWYPHKNLSIISEIIGILPAELKKRVRFVLTLPDDRFKSVFSPAIQKYVINVGPVKPEEGPALYQECDAMFLPTLLECFSASYAEAMKMGKPILTSDLSFAHTVCGDSALYANPIDPIDISEKIIELVENPSMREKLIWHGKNKLKSFPTAFDRAEEYLRICQELANSKKAKASKMVVVNQASNYLTIGLCNAFAQKFETVDLITGSIHVQGEELLDSIRVTQINRWHEKPARKKFVSYIKACIKIYWLLLFRYRKYEVFFVSLPPMAYLLTIILPQKCSMLIWDVYPDVFKITGMKETHPLYRVWASLNKIAFKKAYRLFTIGDRMAGLLEKYVTREKILVTPIWSIFQFNGKVDKKENPFVKNENIQDKFVVQYSGNIGLTHNVEVMVELAERMKGHRNILFQIIGRGPREPYLKSLVAEKNLPNCQFLPFQSDEMFPYSLSAADVGVVILDEVTAKGSVPSKSYNLMSYGIPSLYIASNDSELHHYVKKYNHGKCVSHDNLADAVDFILELKNNRELHEKYSRNAIEASKDYKRSNADRIVDYYLNEIARKEPMEENHLLQQL